MSTITCQGQHFTEIRGIFLDKDGTLANVASYLSRLGQLQAALMEQQLPGTRALTLKVLGFTDTGLTASGLLAVGSRYETIVATAAVATAKGYPWGEALALATTTLSAADKRCEPKATFTPPVAGAVEFLKRLKQAGLKIIMVSADSQDNVESFVDCHGLHTYFDRLQGVSGQHPSKAHPSFFQAACRGVGLEPHQGLVIGDAASDWQMAAAAGGFIGFLKGWSPPVSPADILQGGTQLGPLPQRAFVTNFRQIEVEDARQP